MQTSLCGRKTRKLYIEMSTKRVGKKSHIGLSVRDGYGKLLEEYKEVMRYDKLVEYKAAVKSLEIASKYCRDKVYVFTGNRLLVNHVCGTHGTKDRSKSKIILEIKFLQGFFKCVRFFKVKGA